MILIHHVLRHLVDDITCGACKPNGQLCIHCKLPLILLNIPHFDVNMKPPASVAIDVVQTTPKKISQAPYAGQSTTEPPPTIAKPVKDVTSQSQSTFISSTNPPKSQVVSSTTKELLWACCQCGDTPQLFEVDRYCAGCRHKACKTCSGYYWYRRDT